MARIRQPPRRRSKPPTLYGRDRERAVLRDLLDEAVEGHGSLVLVSGEAGIGKTTLVQDLVQHTRDCGALILSGGCYDLTTTPPYGPWVEAIRQYQPAGDQPAVPAWFGDPEELAKVGSQTALFEETRRFFASIATQQTLLIVLEDLHWSDAASLEALRYLARTLGEAAILLVVTYRNDELTRRHELYQLLPLLVRESQAQRIHLNRLDRDDIRELVASRYDLMESATERLVAHVVERSEGNPFFASEILQGLEDEDVLQSTSEGWQLGGLDWAHVPALLRQTLDVRLDRLSPDTRTALRVAAVIGQIVPLDLWQTVAGLDDEAIDGVMIEAIDGRVLEDAPNGIGVQFRHALLREALYEALILTRRRACHRQAGEALAATPNPDPDAVAHHFLTSGDARAAHWLIRAGVRAESSYALRVAAGHYVEAQALLEADHTSTQARGWLLLHIGHLLRHYDSERSIAYLEDAAQAARQIDDPVLAAYSQQYLGLLHCFQGEPGTGLMEMERAKAMMDEVTTSHEQRAHQALTSLFPAEVLSNPLASPGGTFFKIGRLPDINTLTHTYVLWLAAVGRFHDALRVGEPYIEQVTAATDDVLLIRDACRDAYNGLATAADWLGRPGEARRWRTLALDAYEAIGHQVLVGVTHQHESEHLLTYETSRVAERRRASTAAIAAAERVGGAWGRYPSGYHGVPLDLVEGRWDAARELARTILGDQLRPAQLTRLLVFSRPGQEQGDDELAAAVWADMRKWLSDGPTTEPGQRDFSYSVTAQRLAADEALTAGDLEQARAWIEAHGRWLDWSGAVLGRSGAALLWARYHQASGDLDLARQHAQQALDHASDPRQPLALIAAHRFLGQLATDAARYGETVEHLQTALDLARRCEAPYEQALTMLALAELAAETGDGDEARWLLGEARAICRPLSAERSLERADEIEARLGKPRTDHPAGLSSREVEVLALAAEGLTNAAIGEALFISRRTVAQHLRSVYNKLGVNSRAAAVARWADLTSG